MRNEKSKIFDSVVCTIENKDIREFAKQCIETIPDYFWEVGASSTGKYHPQYALGELGLARHTCAYNNENIEKFNKWLEMLLKMGRKHITVLRFIDISIMTEGLHRAGQDDVDAHARRFDNRIIRNSTRLATFGDNEVSEW